MLSAIACRCSSLFATSRRILRSVNACVYATATLTEAQMKLSTHVRMPPTLSLSVSSIVTTRTPSCLPFSQSLMSCWPTQTRAVTVTMRRCHQSSLESVRTCDGLESTQFTVVRRSVDERCVRVARARCLLDRFRKYGKARHLHNKENAPVLLLSWLTTTRKGCPRKR